MQKQSIVAVIYNKRGRVLSIGQNSYVHSCQLQRHHATKVGKPLSTYRHAETDAIHRCTDLSKAHKIVVTRIKRDGTHGLAKPCDICMSAINATNIKVIEWSTDQFTDFNNGNPQNVPTETTDRLMPTTKIDNCVVHEDSVSVRFENPSHDCDLDFDVSSHSKTLSVSTTNIINMQDESCFMELTEANARKLKDFLNSQYPDQFTDRQARMP